MRFFDKQDVPLTFKKFHAEKDKKDNRTLWMIFFITLTPDLAAKLPPFLRHAYASISDVANCQDEINFNRAIERQNVTFYDLPQHRGDTVFFQAVDLEELRLERETKDGNVFTRLYFTITAACDKASGPWALDRFTNDLHATFGEAQVEMFEGTKKDRQRAAKQRVN